MPYSLKQITSAIGLEYQGQNREISGMHTLLEANDKELSFFNSEKYIDQLQHTKAAAVLIEKKYVKYLPKTTISLVTDEPYLKLALASKIFNFTPTTKSNPPIIGEGCDIDSSVVFGKDVTIGNNVTIMAGCYVGDEATIDSHTIIYPNVSIYHHTYIGSACIVHSGAVVGADGYGFAHTDKGKHVKIYQNGNVIIGDSVEIGANTTIDRAVFGSTIIGSGTKIDNLVQIAHNCQLGEDCLLACQTALAGSTTLGRGVTMGGQSGATGHLMIGDGATIVSRCGVTKSLIGGKVYGGFPAIEHRVWLKMQAKLQGLLKKK